MVHVIKSVEFDQDKHEKYVMVSIYNSEVNELREGIALFEDHFSKVWNPNDPSDKEKMQKIKHIKESIDEVWNKLRS